ncbi:MAG TPA: hypothetical protein VMU93_05680 [Caulobacteraceae bacterium]|nr:hypothetical protein [Caulobacteraceae bacterium]
MGGKIIGLALGLSAAVGALVRPGAPARADPRLDEVVYSPYVENHMFEFETRYGREVGDGSLKGAQTLVNEFEYGLDDRLSLALVTKVESAPGQPRRLTGVGVEGIYYLGQIPKLGVDAGLYLEGVKGAGGAPDGAEAKLLLARTSGRFQGLVNFIVERPFDGPRGEVYASYGYAASVTWRTVGNLRLGAEAFGDFGDDHGFLDRAQGAYVGPQLKWKGQPKGLPFEIEADAGWLAAVGPDRGEAPSQARINLELERRF